MRKIYQPILRQLGVGEPGIREFTTYNTSFGICPSPPPQHQRHSGYTPSHVLDEWEVERKTGESVSRTDYKKLPLGQADADLKGRKVILAAYESRIEFFAVVCKLPFLASKQFEQYHTRRGTRRRRYRAF